MPIQTFTDQLLTVANTYASRFDPYGSVGFWVPHTHEIVARVSQLRDDRIGDFRGSPFLKVNGLRVFFCVRAEHKVELFRGDVVRACFQVREYTMRDKSRRVTLTAKGSFELVQRAIAQPYKQPAAPNVFDSSDDDDA